MHQIAVYREVLPEIVRRIVDAVQPLRIVLFGSAARDEMHENSDVDVLVVMPDGVHRRKTAQRIYRSLLGVGFAADVVVATESDIREHGNDPSLVYAQALAEGKELYHAVA